MLPLPTVDNDEFSCPRGLLTLGKTTVFGNSLSVFVDSEGDSAEISRAKNLHNATDNTIDTICKEKQHFFSYLNKKLYL